MSRRTTKQRRAALRRRGRNGDFKRRFIDRVSAKVNAAERRLQAALADIIWNKGGFTAGDLAHWL